MRSIFLCTLIILAAGAAVLRAQDTESVSAADGFQCPVGPNGSGEGYYIARGYRPNGHLGDDWNGIKGGDTDMGDPVYATAHGIIVFAKNYHVGWGNVVIIRHGYYEGLSLKYVDSLYGHLADFNVREGQTVKRGQLIGHIGNNNGMYDAHLHFEIRKNINIGMFRNSFPRDDTNYYEPNRFVAAHLTCPQGGKTVSVPINTFPATAPPSYIANKVYTPVYSPGSAPASHLPPTGAGSLATSLRLSHDLERKPAPATPAPKIVTTPPTTPKPVVQSAPVVETPTTASLTKSTPKPSTASTTSIPEKKESTTPSPKSAKTASSKPPAATPSPTKESATASTRQGTTSSTKESATASTKKAATPTPASKSGTTASTKTASTPAPSTKATATTAKSPTTTSTKTPVTPPAPSKETASAKAATPDPAPAKTAKAEPKPSILDLETHEAPTPPSSTGSPIRRSQPAFRVDRFQDLRGMGY